MGRREETATGTQREANNTVGGAQNCQTVDPICSRVRVGHRALLLTIASCPMVFLLRGVALGLNGPKTQGFSATSIFRQVGAMHRLCFAQQCIEFRSIPSAGLLRVTVKLESVFMVKQELSLRMTDIKWDTELNGNLALYHLDGASHKGLAPSKTPPTSDPLIFRSGKDCRPSAPSMQPLRNGMEPKGKLCHDE